VRQIIRATEPQAAITRIVPLSDEFAATGAQRRVQTLLLAAFALVALLMAAVGMYGVLSFVVSGRTREIGVRVALGARTVDALSMVVAEGMRLAAEGVAIGVVAAVGLARLMSHIVFGVSPRDPGSIIAAAMVLLAAAFVASYVPARRAARVDPMTVLRQE
jgi:ABC-type antimicrobial peptide transport system permease subunit